MKRVAHLTTTDMSLDWLLGAQLEALVAEGYEVFGISAPGPHVDAIEARGVRHVPLPGATRSMDLRQDMWAFAHLVMLFGELKLDLVHTHNPKPGIYGRLAARVSRVPVVVNTVHGFYATPDDRWRKRGVVYALERMAASCSDAELFQNSEDLALARRLGIPADRTYYLGNGIDIDRFDQASVGQATRTRVRGEFGVARDEILIGAVGRVVREKGIVELLEACRRLRVTHPNVRLVLVGPADESRADGVPAEVLSDAAREGVVIAGERSDMEAVYAALDVFVLASHREGFPRAAMEAAAAGLPLVLTDIRGCREVVTDGIDGVLVPPRSADALAGALGRLVDDAPERARLAQAARRRAEVEFDQRRVVGLILDLYRRLLADADR